VSSKHSERLFAVDIYEWDKLSAWSPLIFIIHGTCIYFSALSDSRIKSKKPNLKATQLVTFRVSYCIFHNNITELQVPVRSLFQICFQQAMQCETCF
jgi:hypothetical protein